MSLCFVAHVWWDVDRLFMVTIVLSDGNIDATDGGELWGGIGRRFEGRGVRFVLYVERTVFSRLPLFYWRL